MKKSLLALAALSLFATSCSRRNDAADSGALIAFVQAQKTGGSADHWIEMRNMAGDWEKTGLIFGYVDDYGECVKAIAGLKRENFAREYRCVPANE